jgi:hypothetical protein
MRFAPRLYVTTEAVTLKTTRANIRYAGSGARFGGKAIDASTSVLYSSGFALLFMEAEGLRNRAMTARFSRFAFTYRFSFAGERAGETRGEKT